MDEKASTECPECEGTGESHNLAVLGACEVCQGTGRAKPQEPASIEPRQAEQLPPMTEQDMHILVQLLTSAATLGVTRMEFHPARWRMILDNILNHGAFPADKLHWLGPMDNTIEDYSRVVVPLIFTVNDGLLTCMLMQRQPHDDEGEYGEAITTQGPIYPVPDKMTDDEKVQERAREAGIVIPFPSKPKDTNDGQ